jgi:hypothetical protein
MRLYAIPIVKNRWAYYCHSSIPSTSRLTKAVDWSSKKWEILDKAKEDSWKKKLYIRGTNLMNQLDYQEWFFKSVPSKEDIERPLDKVKRDLTYSKDLTKLTFFRRFTYITQPCCKVNYWNLN